MQHPFPSTLTTGGLLASIESDREIFQVEVAEPAILREALQGLVEHAPHRIVAFAYGDDHSFAEVAAFEIGAADEGAAGAAPAAEPGCRGRSVGEGELDIATRQGVECRSHRGQAA